MKNPKDAVLFTIAMIGLCMCMNVSDYWFVNLVGLIVMFLAGYGLRIKDEKRKSVTFDYESNGLERHRKNNTIIYTFKK